MMNKILIIGGVAGGATAAARLRRLDEHAEIVMFERGEHISFANCGLPYHIGDVIADREDLLLQTPDSFHRRFNVDVRTQSEVLSIDRSAKMVSVRDKLTGATYTERYDKLILAPGGKPIKPPLEGIDSERVFTLRDVADVDRIKGFINKNAPRSAAVIGGGFIGVEMAENLKKLGLNVSIVELTDQVIAPIDIDMACDAHSYLRRNGVSLYLGSGLQRVIEKQDGSLTLILSSNAPEPAPATAPSVQPVTAPSVQPVTSPSVQPVTSAVTSQGTQPGTSPVTSSKTSSEKAQGTQPGTSPVTSQGTHPGEQTVNTPITQLEADMVILAIGVKPESQLAINAGLDVNARGGVITDKHMRTSDPDIYAVGDAVEATNFITGQPAMLPLAGPANKQARIAADNICGIPSEYTGSQGSAIIQIFEMTVASTGLNEKTASQLGVNYDKAFLWLPSHAGYYPGSKPMSMKVIFDKVSGKILGAQIVGYDGVDKRCDVLAVAIRAGMTAFDLTRLELCYAPPYSSAKDPVNMAGYVIENVLTGKIKNFHWHDVDALPRDGSLTLLDVRSPYEIIHGGKIDGFMNIPLDDLRERIGELEREPTDADADEPADGRKRTVEHASMGERIGELDKSKPVYVHCQSGLRSYIAARILAQNGYDVYNLSGGFRLYNAVRAR